MHLSRQKADLSMAYVHCAEPKELGYELHSPHMPHIRWVVNIQRVPMAPFTPVVRVKLLFIDIPTTSLHRLWGIYAPTYHSGLDYSHNHHKKTQPVPIHTNYRITATMPGNNNPENWRNVTGLGHGQQWGGSSGYTTNGTSWGSAMNRSGSDKSSSNTPPKALNGAAPSFAPGGGMGRQ